MGKSKGRKVVYFKQRQKPARLRTDEDVSRQLDSMTPEELAEGINNLIRAIKRQGAEISDYDAPERRLYKVQKVRGKLYFLASEPEE